MNWAFIKKFPKKFHERGDSKVTSQIKSTQWVIWTLWDKWNPRYLSFEYSMDLQIWNTGFVWIPTCSKYLYVLNVCEDSLDLWKQVESFENWLDSWSKIQKKSFFKSGFVINNSKRIQGFARQIHEYARQIQGFARQIHGYMIPLYDSRNPIQR